MREENIIRQLAAIHNSTPFAADAELFGEMLFSMDSFSKNEDFFSSTAPEIIGNNMAAAAISDLLASGVKPDFLIQCWNIDDSEPIEKYIAMSTAIENVLHHYNARCIGGDMGCASPWSWTATVGAKCIHAPVKRISSLKCKFDLYASGSFGDANYAAATRQSMPLIELRDPVPAEAIFATDSSGGFLDALENFRRVNHDITVNIEYIPYSSLPELDFPPEFLLIGGVGEYELIYAVPAGTPVTNGIKVGYGDFSGKGINIQNKLFMKSPPPDYRDIAPDRWMEVTMKYYQDMLQ